MLVVSYFRYKHKALKLRQNVRVYSEEKGGNGRVVLEDVAKILLFASEKVTEEAVALVQERIKAAGIEPFTHDDLHLATVDQFEDFLAQCDDLGTLGQPSLYEHFASWWANILRRLIEKKLAHLGVLAARIPFWEEEQARVRRLFGSESNKPIRLREWVTKRYGLTVDWVLTAVTDRFKLRMSYLFRGTAGDAPTFEIEVERNEDGNELYTNKKNTYTPEALVAIEPEVEEMLSDAKKFVSNAYANNNISNAMHKQAIEVKRLKKEGESEDEIIERFWKVTVDSNRVETGDDEYRNFQYEILKDFLATIKKERNEYEHRLSN